MSDIKPEEKDVKKCDNWHLIVVNKTQRKGFWNNVFRRKNTVLFIDGKQVLSAPTKYGFRLWFKNNLIDDVTIHE